MLTLQTIVISFAEGIVLADAKRPQARSARSERVYQPGIGPHSEPAVVRLVMQELAAENPSLFGRYRLGIPYPSAPRQKCDLAIATDHDQWSVEVKMARFRGDNGKPTDEMLMHIISPYEEDRSALTDCTKLANSGFPGRLAIVIYGFDHPDKLLDPAIEAFEELANSRVHLGERNVARFGNLVHPFHHEGRVFGWEIHPKISESEMDELDLTELQDPNTWEDGGEIKPPVESPRAVVPVAFPRKEYQQVAAYAERHGIKTSEFIRQAALTWKND